MCRPISKTIAMISQIETASVTRFFAASDVSIAGDELQILTREVLSDRDLCMHLGPKSFLPIFLVFNVLEVLFCRIHEGWRLRETWKNTSQ